MVAHTSQVISVMAEPQKFVIILFPLGLQGKIWTTILRSQNLSVIWESPDVALIDTLQQLQAQGQPLPDLLLVDTRLRGLNPYALCRWCRTHCPGLKVMLVNGAQDHVLPAERQWAASQGAVDLLPCLRRDSLISNAISGIREVLDVLGGEPLNQRALVSALLRVGIAPSMRPNVARKPSKIALMASRRSLAKSPLAQSPVTQSSLAQSPLTQSTFAW